MKEQNLPDIAMGFEPRGQRGDRYDDAQIAIGNVILSLRAVASSDHVLDILGNPTSANAVSVRLRGLNHVVQRKIPKVRHSDYPDNRRWR